LNAVVHAGSLTPPWLGHQRASARGVETLRLVFTSHDAEERPCTKSLVSSGSKIAF
jgi:hypothetical protein